MGNKTKKFANWWLQFHPAAKALLTEYQTVYLYQVANNTKIPVKNLIVTKLAARFLWRLV